LSLRIYLDDCAYDKVLAKLLQNAGHEIVIPADAGISGRPDIVHWEYARTHDLVVLTKNPDDFEQLHQASQDHAGVFALYQDNDPSRDMTYVEIVRAIDNLEKAGIPIKGTFHILNAWRY